LLPYVGDTLSFVFFNDSGNVFQTTNAMTHSLFRWYQPHRADCSNEATSNLCSYNYMSSSLGVGLRYRTPIGPVRVDFGYNLNPTTFPAFNAGLNNQPVFAPQTTRKINVFFSIGQTF
jgi:outer membrane protein assembly factor BamA